MSLSSSLRWEAYCVRAVQKLQKQADVAQERLASAQALLRDATIIRLDDQRRAGLTSDSAAS